MTLRPDRAEAGGHQVGERDVARRGGAEHADRGDREPEVEHDDDRERGEDRPRELARRVAQLAGQVRDRLPADEREHQQARGGADGAPAVRGERGPVLRAALGQRAHDRHEQQRGEHAGEPQLQPRGRVDAARVGGDDRRDHPRRGDDGRLAARAEQLGDVEAADHRHGRRAEHDAREEPPAGHGPGAAPERGARVGGGAARLGVADAEHGERDRQRHRQGEQPGPGEHGRRARRPRRRATGRIRTPGPSTAPT